MAEPTRSEKQTPEKIAELFIETLSIRLVENRLRPFAEVVLVELAVIERRGAEQVPGHPPRRRRAKEPPEATRADGQEQEEEHRVVVREAVAELPPSAVL